jgi:predicted O-methyltransferase YrrM
MNLDKALIHQTKGFMDEEEGLHLHHLAEKAGAMGPCLEIGSYCGKSTLYLGSACKKAGTVLFSIDHHRGSEEQQPGEAYFDPDLLDQTTGKIDTFRWFRRTLEKAGLEDTVVPMVCTSSLAARTWATPLAMVFIDGGHAYETAFTDYNSWAGFILPGGLLVFHDIFPDPEKGGQAPYEVYKIACGSGLFKVLPMFKSIGILRRLARGERP